MQKVYRTGNIVETVTFMQYGNGWRVKRTVTDTDPCKTHLIASSDHEYPILSGALDEFTKLVLTAEEA